VRLRRTWLVLSLALGTVAAAGADPRIIRVGTTHAPVRLTAPEAQISRPGPSGAPAPFATLAWLDGCWRLEDAKRVVEEEWSTPDGAAMVGRGREYHKPKRALAEEERTRIELRAGRYVYLAAPADQPPDSFPAIVATPMRVVFENKAHDFPQRIGYERVSADRVTAWVEGPGANGMPRRITYAYHRVACAPAGKRR